MLKYSLGCHRDVNRWICKNEYRCKNKMSYHIHTDPDSKDNLPKAKITPAPVSKDNLPEVIDQYNKIPTDPDPLAKKMSSLKGSKKQDWIDTLLGDTVKKNVPTKKAAPGKKPPTLGSGLSALLYSKTGIENMTPAEYTNYLLQKGGAR